MGLKSDLIQFSKKRRGEWVNGGEFERFAMGLGYKASNASRRLRELTDAGILDHKYNYKRQVEYQYLEQAPATLFDLRARQW